MRRWIGIALLATGVVILCLPYTDTMTFTGSLSDAIASPPVTVGAVDRKDDEGLHRPERQNPRARPGISGR